MSDLIERLGKLQDSCNKQELGLLDTDYVFELAGRTADEIERLTTDNERLTARLKKQALLMVEQAKALGKLLHEIERLTAVKEAAQQWADGIGNDSKCYDDICKALAALDTDEARFYHPVSNEEEAAIDAAVEDKE